MTKENWLLIYKKILKKKVMIFKSEDIDKWIEISKKGKDKGDRMSDLFRLEFDHDEELVEDKKGRYMLYEEHKSVLTNLRDKLDVLIEQYSKEYDNEIYINAQISGRIKVFYGDLKRLRKILEG